MSDTAGVVPVPSRSASPDHARPRTGWFPWWVAACLVILTWSTQRQLEIQRSLLAGGQALESVVAESRGVSSETNRQLAKIKELEAATARLEERLIKLGAVNSAVKQEISSVESTAGAISAAISRLSGQAGDSQTQLKEIARESARLEQTLTATHQAGAQLAASLDRLVAIQEAVNADLAEINSKTRLLDRGGGGG